MILLIYGILKKDTNKHLQNRNRLTNRKQMVIKGERLWGGINCEFEINIYTPLSLK